jgi:hypothetical protein
MIKLGIKGKILKGIYSPNGEVLIEDDTANTGGYYIYIWPKDGSCWPDTDKEMLYDDWLENYDQVVNSVKRRGWVIEWYGLGEQWNSEPT